MSEEFKQLHSELDANLIKFLDYAKSSAGEEFERSQNFTESIRLLSNSMLL